MDENGFRKILNEVSVLNYDNGKKFINTDRLDAISRLLWNSSYRRINAQGLFHLYAKAPLGDIRGEILLISSHFDCHKNITRCFAQEYGSDCLKGTFDNVLTNAIVLQLMLEDSLKANVVVAFTGDEEEDSNGAIKVTRYLKRVGRNFRAVVLDVTDMGWSEACTFTVENDFCSSFWLERIIRCAMESGQDWKFVPSDPAHVPMAVPLENIIRQEAEPDESWEYDEQGVECFSLCIPTAGEMHSDNGILVRRNALEPYMKMLRKICLVQ